MSVVHFDRDLDTDFSPYMQRQLGTNWCWAACATSIYNFLAAGNSVTVQADMVSVQKGEASYEVGDAGYLLGSTINFTTKVYDTDSWDNFYSFVVNYVNAGYPILVNWAQDGVNTHYVIVYAYDSESDSLYIYDPQQYGALYKSSEDFYKEVAGAWAIGNPADGMFPMNPLYGELIPDSGVQSFYVKNNKCDTKMSLATTITSNGDEYVLSDDFAYYIRITNEEEYNSSPYLGTSVKIERTDGHSYKQWLHYGNLLTKGKKNLKITKTSYDDVYGYQLNNFWVHFIPVNYQTPFTPTT